MSDSIFDSNNNARLFSEFLFANGLPVSEQQAKAILEDPSLTALADRIPSMIEQLEDIKVTPSEQARDKFNAYVETAQLTKKEICEFIAQVELIVALNGRSVAEAKDVENLCKVWDWHREKKAIQVSSAVMQ